MKSVHLLNMCIFITTTSLVCSAPADIFEKNADTQNSNADIQKEPPVLMNSEFQEDNEKDSLGSSEVDSRSLFNNMPNRRRRWYSTWGYQYQNPQSLGYNGFSRWKPQPYQVSRPYVVPIFGADPRKYLYFPPQPVEVYYDRSNSINTGVPPDNPLKPSFVAPTYLPPKKPVMPNKNTTLRFGDYDDLPVWPDTSNEQQTLPPPSWMRMTTTTQRPQRRPTRPRPPPSVDNNSIIYDVGSGTNQLSSFDEQELQRIPEDTSPPSRPRTTTTTTPRPRPTMTTSTPRPPNDANQLGPSNCVWAVISCCSPSTNIAPEGCFEQRGCPGPFWDRSPCDREFSDSAIQRALEFYNQGRRS